MSPLRVSLPTLGLLLASLAVCGPAAAAAIDAERLTLLPLKRRVREVEAARVVESSLRLQLTRFGEVAAAEETRDVLRRLRLRDADAAPPELLSSLAEELGADWLVVATLHDVPPHQVPDLALSVRLYDSTGSQIWAGFEARSGLDGRKLLGLGVLTSMETLAPELVRRLLDRVPLPGAAANEPDRRPGAAELGSVALVPFTAFVEPDALTVAEEATEATRAVLLSAGVQLASPGCVRESLRRQRALVWGELSAEARRSIRETCGAERILTGSVGLWRLAGSGLEPEPGIGLAVRLLDAASGRILWMDSQENRGWQGVRILGTGRIFSRGVLLTRMLEDITDRLIRAASNR